MIKALWFALKVGLLIALAVWVADHPGSVRIEWAEYTFTFKHTGLFVALLLGFVLLTLFIYQTIKTFVDFPKSLRRYNEIKDREKGYVALTKGLTAVAAGDTKAALQHSKRATKLLTNDGGLPLLLEAQAARLDGREDDAAQSFVALLEHPDASFLGVRGLLQSALDAGDDEGALELAERALELHPKQPWILKITYDLCLRLRLWYKAEKTLTRCEKAGAIDAAKAKSDRLALHLAQAEKDLNDGFTHDATLLVRKALKLDAGFAPASIMMADIHLKNDLPKKARAVISKAWKARSHGALARYWMGLQDDSKAVDALARHKWIEKLLKTNPDSPSGQRLAGRVALEAGLWGDAREHFKRVEALGPSVDLYRALAELEERSGGGEAAARAWLEQAAGAPQDKAWVCTETGHVYDRWHPIAYPHGSFNTIVWDVPSHYGGVVLLNEKADMVDALIEAPETPDSDAA